MPSCPLKHEDPVLDLCHLYNGTVIESFVTAHGGSQGLNASPFHVYLKKEAGWSIRWIIKIFDARRNSELNLSNLGIPGQHSAHSAQRLTDSFDIIRQEFDILASDVGLLRNQRDEYEAKCPFFFFFFQLFTYV